MYSRFLSTESIAIYLFHGVVEDGASHGLRNRNRKHLSARRFESVIGELAEHGSPLTMDDLVRLEATAKVPKNGFVVTFDDGFRNNLTIAAPILKKYAVPAMFYLTTNFVETNGMSWIDRIEWLFETMGTPATLSPADRLTFTLDSDHSKQQALERIRTYVKGTPGLDIEDFVATLFKQAGTQQIKSSNDQLDAKMTWEDVRTLLQTPLFSIGGHSHTHPILSYISPEQLADEIDTSLRLIRRETEVQVRHYSYPEGQAEHYSDKIIALLQDRGILCCPSAIHGTNTLPLDLFNLRRIMVT